MNKGKSYTFSAFASVEACNETNFWGEFCDKKLQRLQCYPLKQQFCDYSIDACHLPDMSPKLVFSECRKHGGNIDTLCSEN